jgi:hypothetical protein
MKELTFCEFILLLDNAVYREYLRIFISVCKRFNVKDDEVFRFLTKSNTLEDWLSYPNKWINRYLANSEYDWEEIKNDVMTDDLFLEKLYQR